MNPPTQCLAGWPPFMLKNSSNKKLEIKGDGHSTTLCPIFNPGHSVILQIALLYLVIKVILANDTEVQHYRMNIRRRSSLALSPNCWSPTKSCNRHHHRTHVNQCHHFFQIYFISFSLHTILLIFLITTNTLSILPVP